MTFDLNNINQLSCAMDRYFFFPFYDTLHQKAEKHRFIALTGPIVGAIDGTFSLAQAVGGVGESAIKGLVNTVKGVITFDWNSVKIGSLQLILGVGVIGISSIPIIAIRTLRISIKMMIDPKQTSEQQLRNYREKLDLQHVHNRA